MTISFKAIQLVNCSVNFQQLAKQNKIQNQQRKNNKQNPEAHLVHHHQQTQVIYTNDLHHARKNGITQHQIVKIS